MPFSEQKIVSKILKGGSWLYLSNILTNLFGFIYWFTISIIGGPTVLGYTSAIIGLASLINGALNLGTNIGLQKFIGEALGQQNKEKISTYFWSTILFSALLYSTAGLILMALALSGFSLSKFSPEAIIICSLLVALGFNINFPAFFTAILKTEIVTLITVIGNIMRLAVGISLVILGWGWIGASLGYVSNYLTLILAYLLLSKHHIKTKISISLNAVTNVVKAGAASWLPNLITLLGQWLGVLAVFGATGALETGAYYIAFMISMLVAGLGTSITMLLLPVLSSLTDGRKRVCWSSLKICYALTLPLVFALIAYPWAPLKLLGKEYTTAANSLTALLISAALLLFTTAVRNLLYSYNSYLKILTLGAATNIPRIILYFILVPLYKGYGAALSFLAGSTTGLITAIIIAENINFHPSYKTLLYLTIIPLTLSTLTWITLLKQWTIGIPIIALASYITYTKLKLISKNEASLIVNTLTPPTILNKLKPLLQATSKIIF